MRRRLAFYIVFLLSLVATAQTATISGASEEYANQTISVYQYSDYFTKNEELIGSFRTDAMGNYTYTFNCSNTREIYMYLGIYKAFLFVSPNKEYEIAMPPRQEKTLAEELNPYFEPVDISLGVINSLSDHDVNILILSFNSLYENFLSEHFQEIYIKRDKTKVEEFERFGVKDKIVSFMLPLGYSFNLDGSMMYMTFASIFIAIGAFW